MSTLDEDQLNELLGKFVTYLGATIAADTVLLGNRLGLYRTLVEQGPLVSEAGP
jgi:hypothetical protein